MNPAPTVSRCERGASPEATTPPSPPAAALDALYCLGHWLLGSGRASDAADVFRVLLLVCPTDERGWVALAACHEQNDQPRVALELYSAGCVAAAPSARCLVGRARMLRALGRDEEAAEAAAQAAETAEAATEPWLVGLARGEEGAP